MNPPIWELCDVIQWLESHGGTVTLAGSKCYIDFPAVAREEKLRLVRKILPHLKSRRAELVTYYTSTPEEREELKTPFDKFVDKVRAHELVTGVPPARDQFGLWDMVEELGAEDRKRNQIELKREAELAALTPALSKVQLEQNRLLIAIDTRKAIIKDFRTRAAQTGARVQFLKRNYTVVFDGAKSFIKYVGGNYAKKKKLVIHIDREATAIRLAGEDQWTELPKVTTGEEDNALSPPKRKGGRFR